MLWTVPIPHVDATLVKSVTIKITFRGNWTLHRGPQRKPRPDHCLHLLHPPAAKTRLNHWPVSTWNSGPRVGTRLRKPHKNHWRCQNKRFQQNNLTNHPPPPLLNQLCNQEGFSSFDKYFATLVGFIKLNLHNMIRNVSNIPRIDAFYFNIYRKYYLLCALRWLK